MILFEAAVSTAEASMHIVRGPPKWEESALVGGEKRHINRNVLAKKGGIMYDPFKALQRPLKNDYPSRHPHFPIMCAHTEQPWI